jgi:hypothetical protein
MMDSNQEGEANAAFTRVREIMRRRGTNFCGVLERWHEAERKNLVLDRQNARLQRENAALRTSDSKPASPAATGAGGLLSMLDIPAFQYWDIGLIVIVVAWASFGHLGVTVALAQVAVILVAAAFTNWFSLIRFFAGLLLALAAYGTMPQQPQFYAGTAAPATPPAPANAALQRQSDESPPSPQTSADPLLLPAIRGSARGL